MDCAFCNEIIIKKQKFYEDENFFALYNLRPVVKGHCLIIPKRHIEQLYQMNENERKDFISFSNKVLFISLKYSSTNEYDFLMQNGENAGQSIKHLHFHIIPRKRNDALMLSKREFLDSFQKKENSTNNLSEEEIKKTVNQLIKIAEEHRIQIDAL